MRIGLGCRPRVSVYSAWRSAVESVEPGRPLPKASSTFAAPPRDVVRQLLPPCWFPCRRSIRVFGGREESVRRFYSLNTLLYRRCEKPVAFCVNRERFWHKSTFEALEGLRGLCEKHKTTLVSASLRWLHHHSMLSGETVAPITRGVLWDKPIEDVGVGGSKGGFA